MTSEPDDHVTDEDRAQGTDEAAADEPAVSVRRGPDSSSPLPSFGRYGGPQGRSAAEQGADDHPAEDAH
jgi:hypothetical protein